MEDLAKLRREDLERRLSTLLEELEELEEEKSFVLKQTGLHVPGGKVRQYEAQTQALKESIDELRLEISNR
jgi:prefoldin subunit 5